MNLFFKECKIYILFFYITTWCRVSAFLGPVFICTLVKYLLESDKILTAIFPNGFRIYACKRAKNSTAFPRISQNIKSCNDSNSVEQLQKMRNVWGTQSNLMRLLVLQMTVNEMLKNPQHLWHFLDLLKSLKTPRKSFLVAEKDNQCASSRTLLSFFPGLFFFSSPDSEQILIPFFAAGYLIDPIWGRGGIERRVSASNQADHGDVSQSFLHHLISSLFVGCYQSQAQVRAGSTRESLHYLLEPSSRHVARLLFLSLGPCLQVITL